MVTIRKCRERMGLMYEIEDFEIYRRALLERGIEPPRNRYRVWVAQCDPDANDQSESAWEEQIQRFFELTPASDVPCRIVDP
ncbi:MAG TPA: hypothetical protein VND64_12170 [Pirellulales bacterium]|nr:hypothetical protein [Pirellulales bacterium]